MREEEFYICQLLSEYCNILYEAQTDYAAKIYLSENVVDKVCGHFAGITERLSLIETDTERAKLKADLKNFWQETFNQDPFGFRFGAEGVTLPNEQQRQQPAPITEAYLRWMDANYPHLTPNRNDLYFRKEANIGIAVMGQQKWQLKYSIKLVGQCDTLVDAHWNRTADDYWHTNRRLSELAADISEAMGIDAEAKQSKQIYKLLGKHLPFMDGEPGSPESYIHWLKPLAKLQRKHAS